jgi:adenine-specific DNA methylase
MQSDRRLIEDSLPLEIISIQSAREKSIRHGHISTLHIWWARRPLAAMRAAIFASLIPAPKDDAERDYLHKLIGDIVNWDAVKDGNNARVEEARALIRKHYPDAPPKILDPFMGGGSTGLEALRLGAEAYGVELNPVAYLIQLCTLVYPQKYGQPKTVYTGPAPAPEQTEMSGMEDPRPKQMGMELPHGEARVIQNPLAEDVRKWGIWVLEEARQEIGHLYEDPEGRTIIAYVWARTAKCPNPQCGAAMPMVRQWWLAKTGRKRIAIRMNVDKVTKTVSFSIEDVPEREKETSEKPEWPDEGTMRRGTIICPVCGTSPSESHLKTEGLSGRLGSALMGVIFDSGNGKSYRAPTIADQVSFSKASAILERRLLADPEALPVDSIPLMSGTFNAPIYGLNEWGKLFNTRQAITLITFVDKIRAAHIQMRHSLDDEYAKAVSTYLGIIFDRVANQNNTLCRWDNTRDNVQGVYSRQALPMVWDYVEANPFSGSTGDWLGGLEWVIRVIENVAHSSTIPARLRRGDATRLQQEPASITAIITDPPYYDAVPYADLSDFFYVWLRRTVGDLYQDIFLTPLTPKDSEITEMAGWDPIRYAHKNKEFYEHKMTEAFSEAQRALKPDGIFVVVFAHKSTAAWETLINSLLSAELVISASWPLSTEMGSRLRAQDSAALASSIFIVCRKRQANDDGFFDDVRREMTLRIKERLDFFWSQGIRGADFFISAIGPAVEVFGRYRAVRKLSGEIISVAVLLDLVQEAVADYTLSRVLNGHYKMGTVDVPTRFYVMYRWSYGNEKLLFDDARRLAQALGAEVSDLTHTGLLKQSGDSVTMPSALERKKQEHLGEAGRDGAVPSVVDVLHRAVLVWQEGDRRALAEYLAQNALGRDEEVNAVAQALVNVLPQGDRERQILENYLQGSNDLPDVITQQRLM